MSKILVLFLPCSGRGQEMFYGDVEAGTARISMPINRMCIVISCGGNSGR